MQFLTIWTLFAAIIAIVNADPVAKIVGGQQVDDLNQFPHHVYITLYPSARKCAGSTLNAKWVLTSAQCVKDSVRLELNFGMKNEFDFAAGYFALSVNGDQIYLYSNNYDDVALVRLPVALVFSATISSVSISRLSIDALRNKFAVMPGFEQKRPITTTAIPPNYDVLLYGMFNVVDQSTCKQQHGPGKFDEYNQLCVERLTNTLNYACDSDFGSGLLIGWPAKGELIGMLTTYSAVTCNYSILDTRQFAFTYVAKYLPWIESMIQG